jgi:hypothetical protein
MAVFTPFALVLATDWASHPASSPARSANHVSFRPSVRLPCPAGDIPKGQGGASPTGGIL